MPSRHASRLAPLLLVLAACAGDPAPAGDDAASATAADLAARPIAARDDGGTLVQLDRPAQRVVSLVPSGTELVVALGGGAQLVGRTRYDTAPEVASLPSVGGGLDPSLEALAALRPDLVLAWELDPGAGTRARIAALGAPTFALQSPDTTALLAAVEALGRLLGRDSAAGALAARLRAELDTVRAAAATGPRPSVFYVVSSSPPMTAGPDTFVGQLVGLAGGRNVFAEAGATWPTVSLEEIVRRDPDVVILPTGEDPTRSLADLQARPGWREIPAVREGRVAVVPADLVNRPGPNVGEAARVLQAAIRGAVKE